MVPGAKQAPTASCSSRIHVRSTPDLSIEVPGPLLGPSRPNTALYLHNCRVHLELGCPVVARYAWPEAWETGWHVAGGL